MSVPPKEYVQGEGVTGEPWGFLGKIRGITTPPPGDPWESYYPMWVVVKTLCRLFLFMFCFYHIRYSIEIIKVSLHWRNPLQLKLILLFFLSASVFAAKTIVLKLYLMSPCFGNISSIEKGTKEPKETRQTPCFDIAGPRRFSAPRQRSHLWSQSQVLELFLLRIQVRPEKGEYT